MSKWVPVAATFGLLCLLIIPAPGIWGVVIGGICALAIIVSVAMLLLDRAADRFLAWRAAVRRDRRQRAVHAGSGISRKI